MAIQPTPPKRTPPRNKGLIAGLITGNQWFISPKQQIEPNGVYNNIIMHLGVQFL